MLHGLNFIGSGRPFWRILSCRGKDASRWIGRSLTVNYTVGRLYSRQVAALSSGLNGIYDTVSIASTADCPGPGQRLRVSQVVYGQPRACRGRAHAMPSRCSPPKSATTSLLFSHEFASSFWKGGELMTFQVPTQTFTRRMADGTIGTVNAQGLHAPQHPRRRLALPSARAGRLRRAAALHAPLSARRRRSRGSARSPAGTTRPEKKHRKLARPSIPSYRLFRRCSTVQ